MTLVLFASVRLTNNGMNGKTVAIPPFKLLENYASERVRRYIWMVPYACTITHMACNNLIWWDPGTIHVITICLLYRNHGSVWESIVYAP